MSRRLAYGRLYASTGCLVIADRLRESHPGKESLGRDPQAPAHALTCEWRIHHFSWDSVSIARRIVRILSCDALAAPMPATKTAPITAANPNGKPA